MVRDGLHLLFWLGRGVDVGTFDKGQNICFWRSSVYFLSISVIYKHSTIRPVNKSFYL